MKRARAPRGRRPHYSHAFISLGYRKDRLENDATRSEAFDLPVVRSAPGSSHVRMDATRYTDGPNGTPRVPLSGPLPAPFAGGAITDQPASDRPADASSEDSFVILLETLVSASP